MSVQRKVSLCCVLRIINLWKRKHTHLYALNANWDVMGCVYTCITLMALCSVMLLVDSTERGMYVCFYISSRDSKTSPGLLYESNGSYRYLPKTGLTRFNIYVVLTFI